MPIDLLQLKAISVAARLGSLSRAANTLCITQPALSRRIADAERTLGLKLFERLPRGVRPTNACIAFLRHAEMALAHVDDGMEAALAAENRGRPELSIAMLDVLCDDIFVKACRQTMTKFSLGSVDFRTHILSANVSSDLLMGAVKLGLRYRKDSRPHLDSLWIADDPIVVACSPKHELARLKRVTMDDLERAQWIGYPTPIDQTTGTPEEALRLAGFQDWHGTAVTTLSPRIQLIEAGFGIGLLRRASIAGKLKQRALIELDTPLSLAMPIFLTWRHGSFLGDAAEYLRDRLIRLYRK
jgi:DNA-binding transcriptional LysR family regulator